MFGTALRSLKYCSTVIKHKLYVAVGAYFVGDVSFQQVLLHDLSKFFLAEFCSYRDRFEPEGEITPEIKADFAQAVEHHYQCNPHHWEYWCSGKERIPFSPMPEESVREMIADWIAASLAYQKGKSFRQRLDISGWLNSHLPRMKLHPETLSILKKELERLREDHPECFLEKDIPCLFGEESVPSSTL